MNTRVIRPKLYEIVSKGGAKFIVKALSERAAKRYVLDMLEGALQSRAVHDSEAYELGRNGADILDATREEQE